MPLCNDVYAGINPEYPEELVSGTIKFLYILITNPPGMIFHLYPEGSLFILHFLYLQQISNSRAQVTCGMVTCKVPSATVYSQSPLAG